MRVLTAAEMGETDRRTVEQFGIPLANLMEAAGRAVAMFCRRQFPRAERVVALCGKGNNGGDGMVAARVLFGLGIQVTVVLLGKAADVKGEAAAALARLRSEAEDVALYEVEDEDALKRVFGELGIDGSAGHCV